MRVHSMSITRHALDKSWLLLRVIWTVKASHRKKSRRKKISGILVFWCIVFVVTDADSSEAQWLEQRLKMTWCCGV